jgi:integrase
VLEAHKARQDDDRKRLGHAYSENDLVFCNEDGSLWPPDTFTKQFANIARLTGMESHFRFHDARHAFASLTLRNGVSVKEVSTLLGHASPTLTLSTYARAIEGVGRAAVNDLAETLLSTQKGEPLR